MEVRKTYEVAKVQLQTGEWKSPERAAAHQYAGKIEVSGLSCLPEAVRPFVQGGREAIKDDQGSMDRLHF